MSLPRTYLARRIFGPFSAMLVALVVLAALAGCGGSSSPQSPTQQIRSVASQTVKALISSHPEDACKFSSNVSKCAQGVMMAKALNVHIAAFMPSDWQSRIANATVTISGDTATMSPILSGGSATSTQFVKTNGHWLTVVSLGN